MSNVSESAFRFRLRGREDRKFTFANSCWACNRSRLNSSESEDLPLPPLHTVLNGHILGQLVVLLAGKRTPKSGSPEVVVAAHKGNSSRMSVADGACSHRIVVLAPVHVWQVIGAQMDRVAKSLVDQALTGLSATER